MNDIIQLANVSKRYEGRKEWAIENINLSVEQNDKLGIIGISGDGKSTLLNIMGVLDFATQGTYHFFTKEKEFKIEKQQALTNSKKISINNVRSYMGFVFQNPFMLSNFSVDYNIELPLILKKIPQKERKERVDIILEELGLSKHRKDTANKLSGGQRQRVAIGRAIVHEPDVVFADEPTGSLDVRTTHEVMSVLQKGCEKRNAAMILITHDPALVLQYCTKVIGIKSGSIKFKSSCNDVQLEQLTLFIQNGTIP